MNNQWKQNRIHKILNSWINNPSYRTNRKIVKVETCKCIEHVIEHENEWPLYLCWFGLVWPQSRYSKSYPLACKDPPGLPWKASIKSKLKCNVQWHRQSHRCAPKAPSTSNHRNHTMPKLLLGEQCNVCCKECTRTASSSTTNRSQIGAWRPPKCSRCSQIWLLSSLIGHDYVFLFSRSTSTLKMNYLTLIQVKPNRSYIVINH